MHAECAGARNFLCMGCQGSFITPRGGESPFPHSPGGFPRSKFHTHPPRPTQGSWQKHISLTSLGVFSSDEPFHTHPPHPLAGGHRLEGGGSSTPWRGDPAPRGMDPPTPWRGGGGPSPESVARFHGTVYCWGGEP